MIQCDYQHKNQGTLDAHNDLLQQLCQSQESFLYSISGFFDQPLNSIEKYDAFRGVWSEIKNCLNIPRTKFQAVALSEKQAVFIIGGKKYDGHRTSSIEVFYPLSGTVSLLEQTLPKPRSGFACVQIDNKLIIVIGGNDGKVLSRVDVLNVQTMEWSKLPSMNMMRDEMAAALGPDGRIYAVGGYGGPEK
jgi:N-acetylneuraminic acid mutarotase